MSAHELQSPLPGTFYRKPAPDAPAFVAEGDAVRVGQVVGLIEVMKQFTELQADADGVLERFLVDNEDAVEPGQAVAVIRRG